MATRAVSAPPPPGLRHRGAPALLAALGFGLLACPLPAPATAPPAEAGSLALGPGGATVVARLPTDLAASLAGQGVAAADWRRAFPVRTAAAAAAVPPGPTLFGDYALDGATLTFRPRLPFLPGTEYVAVLDLAALQPGAVPGRAASPGGADDPVAELRFRLPAPPADPPRVRAIHPASDRVPANLLRAYVTFSTPMRPDLAGDYIRLEDAAGQRVELPFVEIDGGLWDPSGTRLTLLFHPGRLKRGVAPRAELGPPLAEGGSYRLVVAAGWPAANGVPLARGESRSWTVGPPDRRPVDPARWLLHPPSAGTTEPLRVELGEPLDHALAARLVRPTRDGVPVAGRAVLAGGDSEWSFHPDHPWPATDHRLTVLPALEDVAGNSLRGAFDRGAGESERAAEPVELGFRPR